MNNTTVTVLTNNNSSYVLSAISLDDKDGAKGREKVVAENENEDEIENWKHGICFC